MRVSVIRGEHQAEIRLFGSSRRRLREAEMAAIRLLGDPTETKAEQPFGFSLGQALSSPTTPHQEPRMKPTIGRIVH